MDAPNLTRNGDRSVNDTHRPARSSALTGGEHAVGPKGAHADFASSRCAAAGLLADLRRRRVANWSSVVNFDNDVKVHAPFDAMALRDRCDG